MAACVRKAWLTLGSQTLQLEDPTMGYFCEELDLGYPAPREVSNNRPDQDGVDDRTTLIGARTVAASIHVIAMAGNSIDQAATLFAPYMNPAVRPVLHYVLDRPGAPERTLTLRAANYAWPIAGANERAVQLQWVASDPVAFDPVQKSATAWAGSTGNGRVYNLVPNRIYPAGGSGEVLGRIVTLGDLPVMPLLRIYGPITAPRIQFQYPDMTYAYVTFLSTMIVNAGQYVEVDTRRHTAYLNGDPTKNLITSLDWYNSIWPVCPPGNAPFGTYFWFWGTPLNTSGVTQCQAFWQDRYLT